MATAGRSGAGWAGGNAREWNLAKSREESRLGRYKYPRHPPGTGAVEPCWIPWIGSSRRLRPTMSRKPEDNGCDGVAGLPRPLSPSG